MGRHRDRYGAIIHPEDPKWAPLMMLVGPESLRFFEFLWKIEPAEDVELWVYRHYVAGGLYLYLEEDARPWAYTYPDGTDYVPAESAVAALDAGWGGWWLDCADVDELAAHDAAVARAQRLDAMRFWAD
jgi:hypothetical protein